MQFKTKSNKIVSYDEERDLLVIEPDSGGTAIVIDLSSNRIRLEAEGDIEISAGGRLRLTGRDGVEIASPEETIVQGKVVRIN